MIYKVITTNIKNKHELRHDKVLEKIVNELITRYDAMVETQVYYPEGEIDGLRTYTEKEITLYEIKGNHRTKGLFKAYGQLKRAKKYYESIGYTVRGCIYVSKNKQNKLVIKRL